MIHHSVLLLSLLPLVACGSDSVERLVVDVDSPEQLAIAPTTGAIFWADKDRRGIFRSNLDGTNVEPVVEDLSAPVGVAVDDVGGWLYYSELSSDIGALPGSVSRSKLDGSNAEVVLAEITNPGSMSLNASRTSLYIAEQDFVSNQHAIVRLDLASRTATVVRAGEAPKDIQALETVWFADNTPDSVAIRRLADDSVVAAGASIYNGLAVDPAGGRLFFSEGVIETQAVIRSSAFDGANPTVLLEGQMGEARDLDFNPSDGLLYGIDRTIGAPAIFRLSLAD